MANYNVKNVNFQMSTGKYLVRFTKNGTRCHVGRFDTMTLATDALYSFKSNTAQLKKLEQQNNVLRTEVSLLVAQLEELGGNV